MNRCATLKIAISILLLGLSAASQPLPVGNRDQRNGPEMKCLLAYLGSDNSISIAKLLCGAEDLSSRTCYVFTSSKKVEISPSRSGDTVVYKYERNHFLLRLSPKGRWLPFDAISNHTHLFPDSRHWPSRPNELALTICAGVPIKQPDSVTKDLEP